MHSPIAKNLDAEWAAFSLAACKCREADAREKESERKKVASRPEVDLANRLWELGCRSSSFPVTDLIQMMHRERSGRHIEAMERAIDQCTDEWAAYQQRIRQHPTVHRRFFMSKEPDPLRQGPYTKRVFSNVTLKNLTTNQFFLLAEIGTAHYPSLLCKVARAIEAIEDKKATSQANQSFTSERESRLLAERQLLTEKAHDAMDKALGSADAVAKELENTCLAVESERSRMRSMFAEEIARVDGKRQKRLNTRKAVETQIANLGRAQKNIQRITLSYATSHLEMTLMIDRVATDIVGVVETICQRPDGRLLAVEQAVQELQRMIPHVNLERASLHRKATAWFRDLCANELRAVLSSVIDVTPMFQDELPKASETLHQFIVADLRALDAIHPEPPDTALNERQLAVAKTQALQTCYHALPKIGTVTTEKMREAINHQDKTKLLQDEDHMCKSLVQQMNLEMTPMVDGRDALQLLGEYERALKDKVLVKLQDADRNLAAPTVPYKKLVLPHAQWVVDASVWVDEKKRWVARDAALSAGPRSSIDALLHREEVGRMAACSQPPSFAEVCQAWISLWALV